jgi:hypothetical protein
MYVPVFAGRIRMDPKEPHHSDVCGVYELWNASPARSGAGSELYTLCLMHTDKKCV